ncbi:DNA gyrase inhibitor YacG [Sphingomonas sp.]|jgi:hypothetical protein|uniref:DNA gyrase inhibitor YacG n=1 Tax=Sphingomonas sp. TaxID=28214 RepID=UPI002EDA627F
MKPCPVCRKPAASAFAPFCSPGCKDRDLLQWLDEGYRLPGPPAHPQGLDSPDERD